MPELKVPKCEIFDSLNFHDFYNQCSVHPSVPNKYAQKLHNVLKHILSACIRFRCVCSLLSSRISSWCIVKFLVCMLCSVHTWVPDAYAQCTQEFLMHMLSARISLVCAGSANASVPCVYAECIQMNIWKLGKQICADLCTELMSSYV